MRTRSTERLPTLWDGAWIGIVLAAPLLALAYAAQGASPAYPPYALFDWLTRVLPGGVLTAGIDAITALARAVHAAPTDIVAKSAEHALGVIVYLVASAGAGAAGFLILRLTNRAQLVGAAWGILIAAPVSFLAHAISPEAEGLAWGTGLAWGFRSIVSIPIPQENTSPAPADGHGTRDRLSRRAFAIRMGGAAAVITVTGAVIGSRFGRRSIEPGSRWSAKNSLPNAKSTVRPAPGTRPELTPIERHYRIDIDSVPPTIDENQWRLRVGGLVAQPQTLRLEEIRAHPPLNQFVTLECIANPVGGDLIGTTRWTGVSLRNLLPEWRISPSATHLRIGAADGYYETVSLGQVQADARIMLTYAWDGAPLAAEHGFPLRIYVPGLYGMKQPKWITSIEAISQWQPGYWVERGWDRLARVKATSIIDTIIPHPATRSVSAGGIAYAGARGISKVEIQLDQGRWSSAQLRAPLSPLTWVIWRCDFTVEPGHHRLAVRCIDGKGAAQIEQPAPPESSGASGLQHRDFNA